MKTATGFLLLNAVMFGSVANAEGAIAGDRVRTFQDVEQIARRLAADKHVPPAEVSPKFQQLTYDTYRLIAARHETALWRGESLGYWAEFFPAGFIHRYPVEVYEVGHETTDRIDFSPRCFQFRGESAPLAEEQGGLAGLRLLTKLPGNTHMTECVSFLGASYFRGIGSNQWYGSSARGLAVDVGLASPEEFPRFTKFWLNKPAIDGGTSLEVWALMDSPAIAGAYRMTVDPGVDTTVCVQAHVWRRHGVQKLAIAPLTSMFMWDRNSTPTGEARPEVHDADGLLIHTGERESEMWVWRDLERPDRPRVESWPVDSLQGFGLMQRQRDPQAYNDNEAHYHKRPSVWVNTGARRPWGPGRVELLELDADHEGMDNIAAYFVFDEEDVDLRRSIQLEYELVFTTGRPYGHYVASVRDYRVDPDRKTCTVWFGPPPGGDRPSPSELTAYLNVAGQEVLSPKVSQAGEGYRVQFDCPTGPTEATRVELTLARDNAPYSEVWTHTFTE